MTIIIMTEKEREGEKERQFFALRYKIFLTANIFRFR